MTAPGVFELFALRYGHHGGRTDAMNFIAGDLHETGSDLDYFVWLARRGDRTFLIDTGFSEEVGRRRNRQVLHPPAQLLQRIGITAGRIEDVVLTHLHFDHAGTLGDYGSARFHLQDSEMAFATGRCMCHREFARPFEVEDIVTMVRQVHAGRVEFHDGDSEITPGLSLHRIGGHTAGLQAVRVFTARGWVVLASDASHLYANMRSERPFPIVANTIEMLEGFRRVHALADSPDHVVPGHDPLVMALYPPPSPDLEGLVVRLDTPPRQI